VPLFLTWRLFGSLPQSVLQARREESSTLTEGQRFLAFDRQMDFAESGPTWLKQPEVATCVIDTLLLAAQDWGLYELHAWVVMSNHVHVLLTPHKAVEDVTRSVKKTSARRANLILSRTGRPFWQDESYDHWVRDAKEFERIAGYIEWNPVRAGLVKRPEDWPWSSASETRQEGRSGTCPTAAQ